MSGFTRKKMLEILNANTSFDILIIGGGATGLGVAVDAATRGYHVLLAEQADFAKGTSSRSTKLVHGGVRYLAQGNIKLVMEALRERGLLLKNAPHLTKNECIIIPCYSWFRGVFYGIGLKLYDWLAGKLSLGRSEIIGKNSVIQRLPLINQKNLKCGVLYHDGAFDDARLAINLAQTAFENGALVLNYFKVTALSKDADNFVKGAFVVDQETGTEFEVQAKVVVNATGVFADEVLKMDNPRARSIIRPSQGVHLVFDNSFLRSADGIMIPHTADGRVLFVLPWHSKLLAGTTDTPLSSHSLEPRALQSEIDFILSTSGKYLSGQPEASDILSVFAGLRPLAATDDEKEKTKEISRSHKVIISPGHLVSIIGGKWTTYRQMAEDTLSLIIKQGILPAKRCVTKDFKIHGYSRKHEAGFLNFYGTDEDGIEMLMRENPQWAEPLDDREEINGAQVIWAVRNEMARTVEDVLARRTRILFLNARAAFDIAPKVAELVGRELGKDDSWKQDQVKAFRELARGYMVEVGSKKN